MYFIRLFQMTDASQFCQLCDCLFMWSGDICIVCVVDSQWPWGNGGNMVAICCERHVHVCAYEWFAFAKLVFLPDSDIYSLSRLFTDLQENVK